MPRRIDNPYAPGFGYTPPAMIGREHPFGELETGLVRVTHGMAEQVRLYSGVRGTGKTALLNEFGVHARNEGAWVIAVEANRDGDPFPQMLNTLQDYIDTASADARIGRGVRNAVSRLDSVGVGSFGFNARIRLNTRPDTHNAQDRATALGGALVAAATVAHSRNSAVVLTIDEMQAMPGEQMRALFPALQEVNRNFIDPGQGTRMPVLTVFAGLPNTRDVIRDEAGTYAARLDHQQLIMLEDAEVARALAVPASDQGVAWDQEALESAVDAAAGYPYATQVVGSECWNAAAARDETDRRITAADAHHGIGEARAQLANVYEDQLRTLPQRERRYLDAVASLPDDQRSSSRIAAILGGPASHWGDARARLIDRGLLSSPARGQVTIADRGLEQHLQHHSEPNPPTPQQIARQSFPATGRSNTGPHSRPQTPQRPPQRDRRNDPGLER